MSSLPTRRSRSRTPSRSRSRSRSSSTETKALTRLYVGGLGGGREVRESELRDLFARFGKVTSVAIKGHFAFVDCSTGEMARDAIKGLHGTIQFNNRRIIVEHTKEASRSLKLHSNPPKSASDQCYHCGKTGHWARECPERADKDVCYRCHRKGHIARDCPDDPLVIAQRSGYRVPPLYTPPHPQSDRDPYFRPMPYAYGGAAVPARENPAPYYPPSSRHPHAGFDRRESRDAYYPPPPSSQAPPPRDYRGRSPPSQYPHPPVGGGSYPPPPSAPASAHPSFATAAPHGRVGPSYDEYRPAASDSYASQPASQYPPSQYPPAPSASLGQSQPSGVDSYDYRAASSVEQSGYAQTGVQDYRREEYSSYGPEAPTYGSGAQYQTAPPAATSSQSNYSTGYLGSTYSQSAGQDPYRGAAVQGGYDRFSEARDNRYGSTYGSQSSEYYGGPQHPRGAQPRYPYNKQ